MSRTENKGRRDSAEALLAPSNLDQGSPTHAIPSTVWCQLGGAAGALLLSSTTLAVSPTENLPHGGQLPLADIAGISCGGGSDSLAVTICYAPYEPADHNRYKKGPIGDAPNCEKHRQLRPIEVQVACTREEFDSFAKILTGALRATVLPAAAGAVGDRVEMYRNAPQLRPLLVLLNPASGSGAAGTLFESDVAPLLAAAGTPYTRYATAHAGHAAEIVKTIDLSTIQGIVVRWISVACYQAELPGSVPIRSGWRR